MAAPFILLGSRLMVGAWLPGGAVVVPPQQPLVAITSSFSSVTTSPSGTTTMTFVVSRTVNTAGHDTVDWVVSADASGSLTAAWFSDGVFPSGTVDFRAGSVLPVTVSVTFSALAPPASDLGGIVTLRNPSAGVQLNPGQSLFSFAVSGQSVVVTDPRMDDPAGWAAIPALSTVAGGSQVAVSSLAVLAGTVAGKTYVVSSDLSGGTVTIDGAGTLGSPIVIRGSNDYQAGAASSTFKKITGATLNISGASHVYFRDIDFGDTKVNVGFHTRVSFERCLFYGRQNYDNDESIEIDRTKASRYFRARFCQFGKAGVVTKTGALQIQGSPSATNPCPKYIYFYNNRLTNITNVGHPSGHDVHVIGMFGDNERDDYHDLSASVYYNLLDNLLCPQLFEVKYRGVWTFGNTVELHDGSPGGFFKNRHSPNDWIGNLFVTPPGATLGAGNYGFNIGDRLCNVLNNWSVTLAAGLQPTASSPAGPGTIGIDLLCGFIDAALYPTNEGDGTTGQLETNAYLNNVGGNNMPVAVGVQPSRGLPAVLNVVGPQGGPRIDRNQKVTITADQDFYGRGLYRLAATGTPVYVGPPAYGTLKPGSTTDQTTPIVGADITKPPHRMLPTEVGPDGSFAVVVTPPNDTVGFGTDYTANYRAYFGTDSVNKGTLAVASGVLRLTGGPYDNTATGVRLYNKTKLTNGAKVRWTFNRKAVPGTTTAEGSFHQVGFVTAPSMASGSPANLPTGTSTGDIDLAALLTGFRVSYGTWNTTNSALSNKFRLQTYNGDGTRTPITANETQITIDLGTATDHTMELYWNGSTVTLTCVDLGLFQSFTDPALNRTDGYLMFYTSYGADGAYSNVRQV